MCFSVKCILYYDIMQLEVIFDYGGSFVTIVTQQRGTQYLSVSLADPAYHQIPCNTRSCEVAFRIKIKCSRQFSVFFAPLQIMEDYISLGHNHIFWNHLRSHFCVALLLYCTGYYICLGLVVKVSTPLSQAYLAPFHFVPLLPLSLLP